MNIQSMPIIYSAAVPGSLVLLVILSIATFLVIITFTLYYLYKIITSQGHRRFTGSESIIGSHGIADNKIESQGSGSIKIDGVSWEAINTGTEIIEQYDRVVVTGRTGMKLLVKKYVQQKP
ncbi:MAG: NfeD family protein [Ferroplasma sp.]